MQYAPSRQLVLCFQLALYLPFTRGGLTHDKKAGFLRPTVFSIENERMECRLVPLRDRNRLFIRSPFNLFHFYFFISTAVHIPCDHITGQTPSVGLCAHWQEQGRLSGRWVTETSHGWPATPVHALNLTCFAFPSIESEWREKERGKGLPNHFYLFFRHCAHKGSLQMKRSERNDDGHKQKVCIPKSAKAP
uniref:Secreted protein n=1 Tax=Trypanosoma vivax (strain Y486) TaxID=1055687 RepID=G0TUJ0_TRYVY|nr:hypothetical protein, unlikely [Trypanosoma vivax Y486]